MVKPNSKRRVRRRSALTHRNGNSKLYKQPIRMQWANQKLEHPEGNT